MSADSFDNFPYMAAHSEASAKDRRHYWAVAIGLQESDGLQVSAYARELAKGYEAGAYTLAETGELLRSRHTEPAQGTEGEADLVAQRISELLEAGSFALAPRMLSYIHFYLFQDLDESVFLPGRYKSERLVKQEGILNGDSVLYADPSMVEMSLDQLFRNESQTSYGLRLVGDDLVRFCTFIAHLWQVHPFVEGNTRTTAVFSELYLSSLGLRPATNGPYERHARFYRDALVRANYRNVAAQVLPTLEPLVRFYDNVLNDAGNKLDREALLVPELFEHPRLLRNVSPSLALKP